jgi:diketogulonate reductase-like aldo/keto reductase
MIKIQEIKKSKHIGVSNFKVDDICQIIEATKIIPYVNQIEFSPLCQRMKLVKYCFENNIKVQAYRSFGLGKCLENEVVKNVAVALKIKPAQVILLWTNRRGIHVIPMSKCEMQMRENIAILEMETVDTEKLNELNEINDDYFTMERYKD